MKAIKPTINTKITYLFQSNHNLSPNHIKKNPKNQLLKI